MSGRGYYQVLSGGRAVPTSICQGRLIAKATGEELEIVRPIKTPPLTQRQRNEKTGRCGVWVSGKVMGEIRVMFDNLEEKRDGL